MRQFEFFMIFYGLLLGLAVAELLGGFANLVRERTRPSFGLLTPTLGVLLFIMIIASFIDAFEKLQGMALDMAGLALPTFIGISYFTAAAIVVPRDAEDWPSLDEYFMRRRFWTVGAILAVNIATIVIEVPFVIDLAQTAQWTSFLYYIAANAVLIAAMAIALLAKSRRLILGAMIVQALLMLFFYSPWSINVFTPPSS
jgi:hypothetical protein